MDKAQKPTPWWKQILIAMLPILLLVGMIGYTYHKNTLEEATREAARAVEEANKAAQAEAELKKERIAWPLGPAPKRTVMHVDPPPVPPLPQVINPSSINERLRVLFQTHPIDEVRLEFEPLIANGTITLSHQSVDGLSAQVRIVRRSEILAASKGLDKDRDVFVVLAVNPRWLANRKTDEDIRFAQLVFYHEYQHYKQYLASTGKDRLLWENMGGSEPPAGLTQQDGCEHMWHAEDEAYAAECRVANTWGVNLFGQLCEYVDSPQWNQAMFHLLYKNQADMQPRCGRTWAKLAGHPYPDEFPEWIEP